MLVEEEHQTQDRPHIRELRHREHKGHAELVQPLRTSRKSRAILKSRTADITAPRFSTKSSFE